MSNHHASCVAIGPCGVLIRGASGAGKSTLTLQLIDSQGYGLGKKLLRGQLVSDDQTLLLAMNGKLIGSPPKSLAGLIEIRGLGIITVAHKKSVNIKLVVDLLPPKIIERLPNPLDMHITLEGITLAHIAVATGNPAAAAIVRSALQNML